MEQVAHDLQYFNPGQDREAFAPTWRRLKTKEKRPSSGLVCEADATDRSSSSCHPTLPDSRETGQMFVRGQRVSTDEGPPAGAGGAEDSLVPSY